MQFAKWRRVATSMLRGSGAGGVHHQALSQADTHLNDSSPMKSNETEVNLDVPMVSDQTAEPHEDGSPNEPNTLGSIYDTI